METKNLGRTYRALAICDDTDTCEFCGKTDLMRVVAFEAIDTGEILYAGTTCAETVKLLVYDEEVADAAPRTAAQIISMIERKTREIELAKQVDLAGWLVVVMLDAWRTSEWAGALCDAGMTSWCSSKSYTLVASLPTFTVPATGNRYRFSINLLCGFWDRIARIRSTNSLAARERKVAELLAYIESFHQVTTRRFEMQGVHS